MKYKYNKNKYSYSSNQHGAVLVEYAIVIPILALIVSALFILASLLWQMQVLSEGVRYGARSAVSYSRIDPICDHLENRARDGFDTYLSKYSSQDSSMGKSKLDHWWNAPNAAVATDTWDGFSGQFIKLSASTSNEDNCIFCTGFFTRRLAAQVKTTFPNMVNCV